MAAPLGGWLVRPEHGAVFWPFLDEEGTRPPGLRGSHVSPVEWKLGVGVVLGFPEKTLPVNYTFASRANILNAFLSIKKINYLLYIINKDK